MISRQPTAAAEPVYDLAIVGGGVYGIVLCLEASRRGLATLLLERDDFGSQTSWNSLRILHGGLRYLQSFDLARYRDSVEARTWWLSTFPELVRPLPCVMPLYGTGLRRPSILRLALAVNDLLSHRSNRRVPDQVRLGRGRVLSVTELQRAFPGFDVTDTRGAALWYDAMMPSSERVLMEMLHWAARCGATSLNYVEAIGLDRSHSAVFGLKARDRLANHELEFRARAVVSCVGPWLGAGGIGEELDRSTSFHPSLAVNLLIDRPSLGSGALAVTERSRSSKAFFLCPWNGYILAGTYHAALPDGSRESREEILASSVPAFLEDLNAAMPDLELTRNDVLLVQHGVLPARYRGTTELSTRPVVLHLGATDGTKGVFVVSGVKFTTARQVAIQTLGLVENFLGDASTRRPPQVDRPTPQQVPNCQDMAHLAESNPEEARRILHRIVIEESVTCTDDLLQRRADWWSRPREAPVLAEMARGLLADTLPNAP